MCKEHFPCGGSCVGTEPGKQRIISEMRAACSEWTKDRAAPSSFTNSFSPTFVFLLLHKFLTQQIFRLQAPSRSFTTLASRWKRLDATNCQKICCQAISVSLQDWTATLQVISKKKFGFPRNFCWQKNSKTDFGLKIKLKVQGGWNWSTEQLWCKHNRNSVCQKRKTVLKNSKVSVRRAFSVGEEWFSQGSSLAKSLFPPRVLHKETFLQRITA